MQVNHQVLEDVWGLMIFNTKAASQLIRGKFAYLGIWELK